MFCLRSWITLLVFLSNSPPIFVLLYIIGHWALQKPCTYCSLLLLVLVFSLFDFHADWFEPRWQLSTPSFSETASAFITGNSTLAETLSETAILAVSAINGTGGSLASAGMENVRRRGSGSGLVVGASGNGFEWLRGVLEKRQFRIPCVDVIVRL